MFFKCFKRWCFIERPLLDKGRWTHVRNLVKQGQFLGSYDSRVVCKQRTRGWKGEKIWRSHRGYLDLMRQSITIGVAALFYCSAIHFYCSAADQQRGCVSASLPCVSIADQQQRTLNRQRPMRHSGLSYLFSSRAAACS